MSSPSLMSKVPRQKKRQSNKLKKLIHLQPSQTSWVASSLFQTSLKQQLLQPVFVLQAEVSRMEPQSFVQLRAWAHQSPLALETV